MNETEKAKTERTKKRNFPLSVRFFATFIRSCYEVNIVPVHIDIWIRYGSFVGRIFIDNGIWCEVESATGGT